MLLQTRIKAVVLSLLILSVMWIVVIQYSVVYSTYVAIERAHAEESVWRCVEAIRGESQSLEVLANDWGAWDDMLRFVQEGNPEFQKMNLNSASMESANMNLLCVVDREGSILWCGAIDGLAPNPLTVQAFSQPRLSQDHPLLAPSQETGPARLLRTEHGVMLVASRPILPSNRQGPAQGTVILGRSFSDANVQKLVQQTHVQFTAWNPAAQHLPDQVRKVVNEAGIGEVRIGPAEDEVDVLDGYMVLADIFGKPALVIEAVLPRKITSQGQEAVLNACVCLVIAAVVLSAVLCAFLNRHVVWPLLRLRRRIAAVHPGDDPSARIEVQREDEIGSLAVAFNAVLDGLTARAERGQPHPQNARPQEDTVLTRTGA
jgi:sensor domain CHASE-containing protein